MTRRSRIPQRRRIFFGCEGPSEQGYAKRLHQICDDEQLGLHIDTAVLKGGDPCSRIEYAVSEIARRTDLHGKYASRFILLDSDVLGISPERDRRAHLLCKAHNISQIWQRPTHEAFLIRHLIHCQDLKPPSKELADYEILKHWPDYEKPMSAQDLSPRIDAAAIRRAAQVEEQLAAFLKAVGFA